MRKRKKVKKTRILMKRTKRKRKMLKKKMRRMGRRTGMWPVRKN